MSKLSVERVSGQPALIEWHRVVDVACRHDYVDLPADPLQDLRPLLENPPMGELFEFWIGRLGREVVAAGQLRLPVLDNVEMAMLDLYVAPAARQRGYGRTVFQALQARARELGRSRMLMEAVRPLDATATASAGEKFAAAIGATAVADEVRSRLVLGGVDRHGLDQRITDVQEQGSGYRAMSWLDEAPADMVSDLAVLSAGMSTDAPLEDLTWEPESWPPERYLDTERLLRERGRRRVSAAVIHEATGRVVGVTLIGVSTSAPDVAQQGETIVAAAHRGHRLGLLLKLANLRQLIDTQRETRVVITWNAAVNVHMVAINEQLGFRPVDRWHEWQLEL